MKNKGYTLIEIIGVIVILSLIIMISIPTISGILKSSKTKAYNVQVAEIKSASESWSLLNYENVPKNDGDTIIISVLQLKLANLLPYDFKNPKTGELFPDDMQISITKKGNNIVYEVLTDTGTTNEILNPLAPQIILIGGINQNIEINSSYKELGASAKDKDDNALTVTTTITNSLGNTVSSIDVTTLNKYTIIYSATKDSLTSTIKRIVNVVDTIAPIVTVTGYTNNQYIDLESSSSYSLPAASVFDNSNDLITYQVTGNFSSIIPGSKQVIYKATDESGNIGTFILNFSVKDTIMPTATYTTTVNPTTGRKEFAVTASDSGTGLHEYAYSYDGGATWRKESTFIYEDFNNISLKIRDKAGNVKAATPLTLLVKPNGGVWNSLSSDSSLSLEQGSINTIANPTRAGYSFVNWTISGTGTTISDTTLTMGSVNSTITANWTPNNYTLTVNANSGTWSGTTPQTIACDSTVTIANPTRTNYTFTGWTVSGEGSSISGTTFKMGSENTTITANWTLTSFTVTINANGGTWSGTVPATMQNGQTTTIIDPNARAGYVFSGWTVSGTGSSISGTTFTMGTANTTLTANWLAFANMFTYTGTSTVIDDGSGNWRIKFLTSGTFTPLVNMSIDVFLVGGGGGGGGDFGSGAGGGYTTTAGKVAVAGTGYPIVIGAGGTGGNYSTNGTVGGTTSFMGSTAAGGGYGGSNNTAMGRSLGGNGGSGGGGNPSTGAGGTNGGNGTGSTPGFGQGSTTREFAEATGTLYSTGGASCPGAAGAANTGNGGGGNTYSATGYTGGSGIVVIRNMRVPNVYTYTGNSIAVVEDGKWKIKLLTNGTFTPLSNMTIDVFLVGGGGGGGGDFGSGGGGGYTTTATKTVTAGTGYAAIIGAGGTGGNYSTNGTAGGTTSIMGSTAAGGGYGGSNNTAMGRNLGGNGGSGGGGNPSTGVGGTNGGNGTGSTPGIGQGTTTKEFGESTGTLYSTGGTSCPGTNGAANTGDGGGGNTYSATGYSGGSGIIVIREH